MGENREQSWHVCGILVQSLHIRFMFMTFDLWQYRYANCVSHPHHLPCWAYPSHCLSLYFCFNSLLSFLCFFFFLFIFSIFMFLYYHNALMKHAFVCGHSHCLQSFPLTGSLWALASVLVWYWVLSKGLVIGYRVFGNTWYPGPGNWVGWLGPLRGV